MGRFLEAPRSKGPTMNLLKTLIYAALIQLSSSFSPSLPNVLNFNLKHISQPSLVVLQDEDKSNQEVVVQTKNSNNQTKPLDWNVSSGRSIGSLLMQMQKQNELRSSQSPQGIDAITLDAGNISATENKRKSKNQPTKVKPKASENDFLSEMTSQSTSNSDDGVLKSERLSTMDSGTARELDDSVTWMVSAPSARNELLDSVKVLPLPTVYNGTTQGDQTSSIPTQQTTLRMPDYFSRISRDMRHLAVSIASSIEDVDQWRTFCEEGNGGLMPLLLCIREGAHYINVHKQQQRLKSTGNGFLEQQQEESFLAACSACRAIRDLCAVSPELSAVITDGILRANAAWSDHKISSHYISEFFNYQQGEDSEPIRRVHQTGNNLMHDFTTMLRYANEYSESNPKRGKSSNPFLESRNRTDTRLRCKLYVTQLLLAMTVSSDDAVEAIRDTPGLPEAILKCSSYSRGEQTRRWLRYPGEIWKNVRRSRKRREKSNNKAVGEGKANAQESQQKVESPFIRAAALQNNLDGHVRRISNQILAAIGYNRWVPKIPGQKGLRILVLDGGGSRGMVAVSLVKGLVEAMGGLEVADSFDIIAGTSTGGIISFLCGLRREPSKLAVDRYNQLIKQIFVKSALASSMMLFTTATYDESSFMDILSDILGDNIMLDSRADPAVPYVFCVASKMSSTPTHVALFRNYNYAGGEIADPFTIDPQEARVLLDLPLELEHELIRKSSYERQKQVRPNSGYKIEGSRHPGSFRVLQRYALRASTAAPTVFKPVLMGGELYCDGGIVASNPAAVAVHEARALFPDIPIELVVSIGTGGFVEQKNSPKIGWDGIIGQIVGSATDAEQIHHVLEDLLGEGGERVIRRGAHVSRTRYYRLNPTLGLPDEFPIDVTEPAKLERLKEIAAEYLAEPAQQRKLEEIGDILKGRTGWRKWMPWADIL